MIKAEYILSVAQRYPEPVCLCIKSVCHTNVPFSQFLHVKAVLSKGVCGEQKWCKNTGM